MSQAVEAPSAALGALEAVYRDLDECLASLAVECRACGRCCDFRLNDYRLYASFLERALVEAHCGPAHLTAAGLCGYLVEGRCSAHAWRPLGCRTFFCAPEHKAREQALYEAVHQRIRALTDRYRLAWDYRPLFPTEG